MTSAQEHETDVVVIGAGPTGENVAQYAREGGLDVVLVEQDLVGGECSYHACMPSKALLRPVEVAETTAHLPGVAASTLRPDELLARRDDWVSHYDDSSQVTWVRDTDITLIRGRARLDGVQTVRVDHEDGSTTLHARRAVVVATGSSPVVPDIFDGLHPWTSRDATGVVEVPGRLVIVGGGVVACEAATWLSALGSDVTMLVRGETLLPRMEPMAGQAVAKALTARGVRILTGTSVERATRDEARDTGLGRVHGGVLDLVLGNGQHLHCDEVLVATGRRPALAGLGLEQFGIDPTHPGAGDLPDWLHLVGDAGAGPQLTHMGKYEARVLGSQLAGRSERQPPHQVPTPQVVFTQPQVASVGLTEADAIARLGREAVVTSDVPFSSAAGAALLRDDATGAARLVVERASGRLLGATFVGPETAELVHGATIALVGGLDVATLRHAVPAYPTASELWLRLLEQLPADLR